MPGILIPRREVWTRQPQEPVGIDWSNPIARGLFFAANFTSKTPYVTTPVCGLTFAASVSPSISAGSDAIGLSGGSAYIYGTERVFDNYFSGAFCVAFCITHGAFVNGGSTLNVITGYTSGSAQGLSVFINASNQMVVWINQTQRLISQSLTRGNLYRVVVGRDAAGNAWMWINGSLVSASTGTHADVTSGAYALCFMCDAGTTRLFRGILHCVAYFAVSPRVFGANLSANPWQIFMSARRQLFVSTTSGALNASASGAAQSAGSAGLAAQVALAAVGVSVADGSASPWVSVPLSAVGFSVVGGSASAKTTITLSAAGLAQAAGQANLSASVLLQGAAAAQAAGNAVLAAQLNMLAAGVAQAAGTANLSGGAPGALAAAGSDVASGTAVLSVTVALQATGAGRASGVANVQSGAPGALSAAGGAQSFGAATAVAEIALTAAGFVQAMGAGHAVFEVNVASLPTLASSPKYFVRAAPRNYTAKAPARHYTVRGSL